jgi:hypothetical protein
MAHVQAVKQRSVPGDAICPVMPHAADLGTSKGAIPPCPALQAHPSPTSIALISNVHCIVLKRIDSTLQKYS